MLNTGVAEVQELLHGAAAECSGGILAACTHDRIAQEHAVIARGDDRSCTLAEDQQRGIMLTHPCGKPLLRHGIHIAAPRRFRTLRLNGYDADRIAAAALHQAVEIPDLIADCFHACGTAEARADQCDRLALCRFGQCSDGFRQQIAVIRAELGECFFLAFLAGGVLHVAEFLEQCLRADHRHSGQRFQSCIDPAFRCRDHQAAVHAIGELLELLFMLRVISCDDRTLLLAQLGQAVLRDGSQRGEMRLQCVDAFIECIQHHGRFFVKDILLAAERLNIPECQFSAEALCQPELSVRSRCDDEAVLCFLDSTQLFFSFFLVHIPLLS